MIHWEMQLKEKIMMTTECQEINKINIKVITINQEDLEVKKIRLYANYKLITK